MLRSSLSFATVLLGALVGFNSPALPLQAAAPPLSSPAPVVTPVPRTPAPIRPAQNVAPFLGPQALMNSQVLVNPNWLVAPDLSLRQWAFNTRVSGHALATIPPWLLGYNPYPPPVNYGPVYPSYGGYTSPGLSPYGGASMTSANPGGYGSSPGDNTDSSTTPYMTNPYSSSYPDPYGGGLRGGADYVRAAGQYEMNFQRARLLNQQVEQSRQDTRHHIFEEWLYERANTPTVEDMREKSLANDLRRYLHQPPLTEILNADALNGILRDLEAKGPANTKGPAPDLDRDLLKQINVTASGGGGNLGVLRPAKDSAPLNWPLVLQTSAYQDTTKRINRLAGEAVKLVQNVGQVDPSTLNDLAHEVEKLRSEVTANGWEMTPTQSIEARRFISQLEQAVRALQQPDVANYFTDKWTAKGQTVADLIKEMKSKGLVFAPAVGGDEAAYVALHNYLVNYANAQGGGQ